MSILFFLPHKTGPVPSKGVQLVHTIHSNRRDQQRAEKDQHCFHGRWRREIAEGRVSNEIGEIQRDCQQQRSDQSSPLPPWTFNGGTNGAITSCLQDGWYPDRGGTSFLSIHSHPVMFAAPPRDSLGTMAVTFPCLQDQHQGDPPRSGADGVARPPPSRPTK